MVAYSLRTWRRNGVACDELLFLPGTPHADSTIGNEANSGFGNQSSLSPLPHSGRRVAGDIIGNSTDENEGVSTSSVPHPRLEGDVAAGVGSWRKNLVAHLSGEINPNSNSNRRASNSDINQDRRDLHRQQMELSEDIELAENTGSSNSRNYPEETKLLRSRSNSKDSTISSINEFDGNWDDDPLQANDEGDKEFGESQKGNRKSNSDDGLMVPLNINQGERDYGRTNSSMAVSIDSEVVDTACPTAGDITIRAIRSHVVSDIREGQAQITRFGSLFFFRSTSTVNSTQNATYAPSGPSVVGAALDLSMPILFNFHLFIQAWNHLADDASKTPAKVLPMCFLTALTVRLFVPFGRRGRFWGTIKYTLTAPFHRSRFRDSFLGDVLTSLVRPLQDIAFAAAYYVTGLFGLLTSKYGLEESSEMLESSWILHTVILPSCALLPLWWKFLQTLRQSYDMGHRWPYLGNSFKYLSAAVVIMYGMTHPEERASITWMLVFFLVLVYQIWWDTFMDWELFVIVPKSDDGLDSTANASCCTRISSVRPSSHILLTLQRNAINPAVEVVRQVISRIPSWKQFQIRPRRLYKTEAFYWKIFFFNTFFRFTWMLSFIPSYSLTRLPGGAKEEFESDTDSYIGVLLPVAEIFRRTLWGFLLLEMQTIHMTDGDPNFRGYSFSSINNGNEADSNLDEESEALSIDSSKRNQYRTSFVPSWLYNQLQIQDHVTHHTPPFAYATNTIAQAVEWLKISSGTQELLFLIELCLWAGAFILLGLWATG